MDVGTLEGYRTAQDFLRAMAEHPLPHAA